ncbi:MAG: BolA/IbaG family iron-sulfur metabolism protein [Gammaproteobacteria bacterium]|nr:BolA/IbaG family iron-sulfur metabolism protein [Gammaproteobacteria bacterium]
MVTNTDIKQWIEANLANSEVRVDGDGRHFEAVVVCPAFAGKNLIERHRLVYAALGDKMQATIHALSLKTFTADEL